MNSNTFSTADLAAYQAALERVVYYRWREPGFLRLTGEDRRDFLQRQSTNDVGMLAPDRAVTTVLTSPTARILDVLTLLDEGDSLGAITLNGRAAATAATLRGKIFFMDRVEVSDESANMGQIDIEGNNAAAFLAHFGLEPLDIDRAARVAWQGEQLWVIGRPGLVDKGCRLLAPVGVMNELVSWLEDKGAAGLSEVAREALRIEAGLPAAATELTEDYNPLEAGLAWTVAENKGCYTGQEVIARQITYDKVTRRLTRLRLDEEVQAPAKVFAEGRPVGQITSAAISPRFGPIALAYLKRPYCDQPGATVFVGERGISAQVQ